MLKYISLAISIVILRGGAALAAAKPKKATPSETIQRFLENFSSLESFREYFAVIVEKTKTIISHPTQFRREIVLVLSISIISLLVLVTIVIMISAIRQRSEAKKLLEDVRIKRKTQITVRKSVIWLVLLTFFGVIYYLGTAQPTFCSSCHQISDSFKTWQSADHKNIGCLECHSDPGVSGYLLTQIKGFDNLTRYKLSQKVNIKARVNNDACLKCHGEIYNRTKVSSVLVKHKEIIDAGILCNDCHPATAHSKTQGKFFVMDKCVICHNQKLAKADCKSCHKADIAFKKQLRIEDFPKVQFSGVRCYSACHDSSINQLCTNCHGLLMPHPYYFKSIHASAASAKPRLCSRCHSDANNQTNETCSCHETGSAHGKYSDWFPKHSGEGYQKMGGSCTCHKPDFCTQCHDWKDYLTNF